MLLDVILVSCSVISVVLSSLALFFGIDARIKVVAMEKSTHNIQYVPVGEEGDDDNSLNVAFNEGNQGLMSEPYSVERDELI